MANYNTNSVSRSLCELHVNVINTYRRPFFEGRAAPSASILARFSLNLIGFESSTSDLQVEQTVVVPETEVYSKEHCVQTICGDSFGCGT